MKNKITDLNNHLFAQLERLGEEGLTADFETIERAADTLKLILAIEIPRIKATDNDEDGLELLEQLNDALVRFLAGWA